MVMGVVSLLALSTLPFASLLPHTAYAATAPVITTVQVTSVTTTTAQVSWVTDIPATSRVYFGTTKRMNRTASDSSLVTGHSFALTGLKANTLYYYMVRSTANGRVAYSARKTFTTAALNTPPPVPPPPVAQTVIDGYGDVLATDGSAFSGWFYDSTNQTTTAAITYVNTTDSTKTYSQQATRTVTRTDAVQYLTTTYGTLAVTQPLGFNLVPSQVVTTPGTYKIQSFTLNNTAHTAIQLGTGAQGAFTIPNTPPTTTIPIITSFTANPTAISQGQATSLSWSTTNATTVSIDQSIGSVATTGSTSVSPAGTTNYTLTATNSAGSVTKQLTIVVSATPPPPNPPPPPTTSAVELPRTYIHTSVSNTPSNGQTITVGSGGNLQTALNNAQPGDTIVLTAGAAYTGNFTLPAKTGTGWITITTAGFSVPEGVRVTPSNASSMAKIVTNNTSPVLTTSGAAHQYRFIGVEISLTSSAVADANSAGALTTSNLVILGSSTEPSVANLPHDIIFDRVYVHGSPTQNVRRGFFFNTGAVAVVDSYVADFHEIGADSQAILGANGTGPYKIVNNYLEAAGENMMVGGLDVPNLPADFEVQGNYFYKPTKWMSGSSDYAGYAWVVKNLFEIKFGLRWLINGNVFENNWPMGQTGMAINLKSSNQDGTMSFAETGHVTFTNNIVRHSTWAMSIHSKDTYNGGSAVNLHHVYVANNLFDDIGVWGNGNTIQQDEVASVTFDHNTFLNDRNNSLLSLYGNPSPNFVFTNNIIGLGLYGVKGDGFGSGTASINQYLPNSVFSKNVFYGANTSPYPSGNYIAASASAVGFTNYNNGNGGNYTLQSSSSYKNAGTDGTDIGVNMSQLTAATIKTMTGQ